MQIEVEPNCPLDKFKPCRKTSCAWFTQVRGRDANTGKEIDDWGCAVAWLPVLLIENASQARHTSAAVESFRNEVAKTQQEAVEQLATQFSVPPLIEQGK